MQNYLIMYGADNSMATFQADDVRHAVEQFVDWSKTSLDAEATTINTVELCIPVIGWEADEYQICYATSNDGSWFPAPDLEIVAVPGSIKDADEVEDFIVNHRGED
jgi:hypothetical protein